MRFLVIMSSLVAWNGLILHTLIDITAASVLIFVMMLCRVLNVLVPVHQGPCPANILPQHITIVWRAFPVTKVHMEVYNDRARAVEPFAFMLKLLVNPVPNDSAVESFAFTLKLLVNPAPNDRVIEPVASTFNICTYCSTGRMRRLHGGPHNIYLCTYCSTGSIMREHGGPNDRAIEPVTFTLKMLANPASDDGVIEPLH